MSDYFLLTGQIGLLREYGRYGKPWAIEARCLVDRLLGDAKEHGLGATSLVEDMELALEYIRDVERAFDRTVDAQIKVLEAAREEARRAA